MRIAIIGCGTIGSALACQWAHNHALVLHSRTAAKGGELAKQCGAEYTQEISDAVKDAEVVVLAIKPSDLAALARSLAPLLQKKQLLVSALVATSFAILRHHFSRPLLARIMPNLAITTGEGITSIATLPPHPPEVKAILTELFSGMGMLYWADETKFEALATLTTSFPAVLSVLVEAATEAGIFLGLPAMDAQELVIQTLCGTVHLMQHEASHPGALKWRISSPGGTTISTLRALEQHGFRSALIEAIIAGYEKSSSLARTVHASTNLHL